MKHAHRAVLALDAARFFTGAAALFRQPPSGDFAAQQRTPRRRAVALGVMLAVHLIVAWALLSGLGHRVVEVIKAPIEARIVAEVRQQAPPAPANPLPPPKLAPPPPAFVPPPEVVVNPQATAAPAISAVTALPPAAARSGQPAIADAKVCAPTRDDYPRAALRAEATGTTRIRFAVDAAGKLASLDVVKSAGPTREHKMLDRVAADKLATCRFTPGVDETGRSVGGTFDIEYVWRIE